MPRKEEQAVGSVKSLWRYPVKSMAGEELDASEVTGRGLRGDRAYALIDSVDGKVASAKNPRKWPQLFEFGAAYYDNPRSGAALPAVRITLPDGTVDEGTLDQRGIARVDGFAAGDCRICFPDLDEEAWKEL
jgi:hypothetical protein